jgi:hypothetical protein
LSSTLGAGGRQVDDRSLQDLLADPATVALTAEECKPRLGTVIGHSEHGGITAIVHGRTGRVRALVVPVPGPASTDWADDLHAECTRLSRAYSGRPVAGSRAEIEQLVNRTVYGDQDEVPLTEREAAAEVADVLERNHDLRSLGGTA